MHRPLSEFNWTSDHSPGTFAAVLTRHEAVDLLADISIELGRVPADVEAILVIATSRLSRLRPGTWVSVVMNPNPETSHIVVADDRDREIAAYIDDYIAAMDRPSRVPTAGMSQQVIESGSPAVIPRVAFEEFLLMLSPWGRAYCERNPPPGDVRSVGLLIVPMRVGSAIVGTLGLLDARDRRLIDESDAGWIQVLADRIALSVEHARLAADVRTHVAEMETMRAIASANRLGPDPRAALALIAERVTAFPDVDAADILLLTDDGNEFFVVASAGHRSPAPRDLRIDARWARLESQPSVPEVHLRADLEPRSSNPRHRQLAREGFETFVSIPLHTPARTLGVLNLYSRSVVEWEQSRLDFLDTLAGLLAIAIVEAAPRSGLVKRAAVPSDFSVLEVEILRLVSDGLTNREIAGKLYRSESAVKFHVRRILGKAGVANRVELVRHAVRAGWL